MGHGTYIGTYIPHCEATSPAACTLQVRSYWDIWHDEPSWILSKCQMMQFSSSYSAELSRWSLSLEQVRAVWHASSEIWITRSKYGFLHSLSVSLPPPLSPISLFLSLSISYLVMATVSLRAVRTFTHIINDTSSLGAPGEWAANLRGSGWWAISVECNNYRRAALLLLQRWMVTEDRSQGLFTHQLVGRKCMFSRSTPC